MRRNLRLIVPRLCSSEADGKWVEVYQRGPVPYVLLPESTVTDLVPTGAVEWDGDRCAEVFVPVDRLAEWRAEWEVEP